jgi:hypothetical protein
LVELPVGKADKPTTEIGPPRSGGADRDRTDDLKLAKLALSQLSYGPDPRISSKPVTRPGPTHRSFYLREGIRRRRIRWIAPTEPHEPEWF